MPLRVTIQAEPFTEYSKGNRPVLAISNQYSRLYRDLERYTSGQILGRSYLIAGHRGSGKTMLVHKAIEDLLRNSLDKPQRPLFVRLHGPDLLPSPGGNGAGTEQNQPENKPVAPANQIAIAFSGDSPASVTTSQQPADTGKADTEMVAVLVQMMKCLFRDVTNEFRRCFREAILRTPPGIERQELLEISAELDLELIDSLTTSRLRSFWHRIGALEQGVLFTVDRTRYRVFSSADRYLPGPDIPDLVASDLGMQEILVLSFLSQAFQVISGKVEEKKKESEAAKAEVSSSLNTAYAIKDLLAPLAGLLSGGAVALEVGLRGNPVGSVLLGLLTGTVVSLGFNYSSSQKKSKETSLESVFIKDRSVPTLSGVLPLLVMRLKQIGLAPVFVVDELDKVENLEARMQKLVQHLKYLVTENSFSCFLTDRRYHSYLERQAHQIAYAPEYTYFSDRLLVLYEPSELREFVKEVLEYVAPAQLPSTLEASELAARQERDEQDKEKIAYVLLHRARLHPIDLRREIDRLATRDPFSMFDFFQPPRYRFEILIQVAIEWLLDGDDVQTQIDGDPDSRQILYDALYYVSRLWEDASSGETQQDADLKDSEEEEKKPAFVLDKARLSSYIKSRFAPEKKNKPKESIQESDKAPEIDQRRPLSGTDFDFLFIKVRDLLNWLCNPEGLYQEIIDSSRPDKPPRYILDEIPAENLLRPQQTLEKGSFSYRWIYDASGRYLQTRDVNTIIGDVRLDIGYIQKIRKNVDSEMKDGSLQTMADVRVLPVPPEWRNVEPAMGRLARLIDDQSAYGRMSSDRNDVVEFAGILREFEPNLKAALMCAGMFAGELTPPITSEAQTPEPIQKLSEALVQVYQLAQLSASQEDDLRKMNLILNSSPTPPLVSSDDTWDKISSFVRDSLKSGPTTDPTPIIVSAWKLYKDRFTQRFRDGTAQFDPRFQDLFTSLRAGVLGTTLSRNLSTVTAASWTALLLQSFFKDVDDRVPDWVRVAASLELGWFDLAEKLAKTVPAEDGLLSQWVRDAKLRMPTQTPRRGALVLAAAQKSITEGWKPSVRHASLISTPSDFGRLMTELKGYEISKPGDFSIDFVAIELVGTAGTLSSLATLRPSNVLTSMYSMNPRIGSLVKELDPFLSIPGLCYFTSEQPLVPTSGTAPQTTQPVVVAPKGIDDLIERPSGVAGRPPSS
jgi:hypothetical protein